MMNKYKVEIKSEFCNETDEGVEAYSPTDAATISVDQHFDYIEGRAEVKVTNESTGEVKYFCTRPSFTVHASTEEDFND